MATSVPLRPTQLSRNHIVDDLTPRLNNQFLRGHSRNDSIARLPFCCKELLDDCGAFVAQYAADDVTAMIECRILQ